MFQVYRYLFFFFLHIHITAIVIWEIDGRFLFSVLTSSIYPPGLTAPIFYTPHIIRHTQTSLTDMSFNQNVSRAT